MAWSFRSWGMQSIGNVPRPPSNYVAFKWIESNASCNIFYYLRIISPCLIWLEVPSNNPKAFLQSCAASEGFPHEISLCHPIYNLHVTVLLWPFKRGKPSNNEPLEQCLGAKHSQTGSPFHSIIFLCVRSSAFTYMFVCVLVYFCLCDSTFYHVDNILWHVKIP